MTEVNYPYEDYLKDNKFKKVETSKVIHKAMNIAAKKVAYDIEKKYNDNPNSPTSVIDSELEKIGNYICPGGNKMIYPENKMKLNKDKSKLKKYNVVELAGLDYKTNMGNLKKLQSVRKDLPEELKGQYDMIQNLIKQVPDNVADCKEKAFNDQVNEQIDQAIDRLANQKNQLKMKERITQLVGKEPTKEEVQQTKEALAAIQKQNQRASSNMKDMLKAVMESLENTNDAVKAEAEYQAAHRNQQFMFRRKVREYQRIADEWRDSITAKVNSIKYVVDKTDATINARKMTTWNASYIWAVWYGEDIVNLFKSIYERKGLINIFMKLIQPLFTSCQIAIGWLNEVIKALGRLYNCFRQSPLLCLATEVAAILTVVMAAFVFYMLVSKVSPKFADGAKFLLQGAISWLSYTFDKIIEYIGPEVIDSIGKVFLEGKTFCLDLLSQLGSFVYSSVESVFNLLVTRVTTRVTEFCTYMASELKNYLLDIIKEAMPSFPTMKLWYKDYVLMTTGVKPDDLQCFTLDQRLKLFGYNDVNAFESCAISSIIAPFIFINNSPKLKF